MPPSLRLRACAALLGAALLPGGCAFHRTVSNPSNRGLDPSWVVVGRTTWEEVLDRWGPPMPPTDQAVTSTVPTLRYFRYPTTESTQFSLLFPPSWLILPWSWRDEQRTRDVFIEFDGDGVASDVYVRTEDVLWRPFEGEGGRGPGSTVFPSGGGRP